MKISHLNSTEFLTVKKGNFDYFFLIIVIILIIFGLVLIYDASIVYSELNFKSKYYFVFKHLVWVIVGSILMYISAKVDLLYLKKHSFTIFTATLVVLIFVLLPTIFSPKLLGARRWLYINPPPFPAFPLIGVLGFQPSEFAKLSAVLYFANFLSSDKIKHLRNIVINRNFLISIGLLCLLVLLQPNYSTALIIFAIVIGMYILSGLQLKYFLIELPVFLLLTVFYAFSSSYRRQRIATLFNEDQVDSLRSGYQIKQILIALGSGGFTGLGLGSSMQKYAYLPEVTADSIFAILGEELGLIGTLSLLVLYLLLIYRGFYIAKMTKDAYMSLIAYGVIIWVSVQSLINLLAMVKLFPITGIPLPLVSAGGSSTIFLMIGLGLVLNISRYKKYGK